MSVDLRTHTLSIMKLLKTYYAFYIRFGLNFGANQHFGLKNEMGGVGGRGCEKVEKDKNRPKNVFFLPLGPEIERQVTS